MANVKGIVSAVTKAVVPADIAKTNKMVSNAVRNGLQKGKRYNQINQKGVFSGSYVRSKSVARELGRLKFTKDEIPALAATVASVAPVPIPGFSLVVYALGHAVRKVSKMI